LGESDKGEATEGNEEEAKLDPPRGHVVTVANGGLNVSFFHCEKYLIISLTCG